MVQVGELACTQDDECAEMIIVTEGSLVGVTTLEPHTLELLSGKKKKQASYGGSSSSSSSFRQPLGGAFPLPAIIDKQQQQGGGGGQRQTKAKKKRHIGSGDSINELCALKVWNRCVETVEALSNVSSYAVNADEFYRLFNHDNEMDERAFLGIVSQEVKHDNDKGDDSNNDGAHALLYCDSFVRTFFFFSPYFSPLPAL